MAVALAIVSCINVTDGLAAEISSGSGAVISAQGDILTNAHVVERCLSIVVKLAAGNTEAAALVTSDERNDLALVRLREQQAHCHQLRSFETALFAPVMQ
jgi:S1-C subfamily serine protease